MSTSLTPTTDPHPSNQTARWERARGTRSLGLLLVLAVAASLLPAAVTSTEAAEAKPPPRFANALYRDRHVVDRLASARIDKRYGCAVVTPRTKGKRRALLIHVNGRAAAKRLRGFRSKLRRPGRAKVRLTSKRHRERIMNRLLGLVRGYQPHTVEATATALESPLNRRRCPRVEITLLPEGEASDDQERWAREMRTRYGRDRVVVRRAELTLRRPAP